MRTLRDAGYRGRVFPVNPAGGVLFGRSVARSVDEIDGRPDLALICTPAPTVPDLLDACARKGVAGAVVLAVGFGEADAAGDELEDRLRAVVHRTGIRVVGPNTSGLMNPSIGLNLMGIDGVRAGGLALLTQSGNLALSLLMQAARDFDAGISICVGIGNETDVALHEYLDELERDDVTRAIVIHAEGVRDGRAFFETARRVARSKPIVLLKGGRSDAGRAAARSHTGALAGHYATFRAALRQAGVIEVRRSDELMAVGTTLATQPPVRDGDAVAILTDGGGEATLASDALTEADVPLAEPADVTRDRLRRRLGSAASVGNPVDVAGAADRGPAVFAACVRDLLADDAAGGLLLTGLFGGYALRFSSALAGEEAEAASAIAEAAADAGKPVVVASIYADADTEPIRRLRSAGVPVVRSLDIACRAMRALWERPAHDIRSGTSAEDRAIGPSVAEAGGGGAAFAASGGSPPSAAGARSSTASHRPAPEHIALGRHEGRTMLLEPEARALLAAYAMPLVPATFCATAAEVREAAGRLGGPVAVKAVATGVAHKLDAGGVALDLADAAAAVVAFERMREMVPARAAAAGTPAEVRGVLVAPMLPSPVAEVLVGVRRDPSFGPALTVGAGGSAVEAFDDVALRVLPVSRREADAALDELRLAPVLRGDRTGEPADRAALLDAIAAVATCAIANPEIREIEANPVFAYADRAVAVDVRAFLADAADGER